MVCLHWEKPRPRSRPILKLMELGLMIMLGGGYRGPRLMQISVGSVHILSVSVSLKVLVSGSANEPYNMADCGQATNEINYLTTSD